MAFQIFVEMPTFPKKTATLMVWSRTTVGEVKAMVEAKEGHFSYGCQGERSSTKLDFAKEIQAHLLCLQNILVHKQLG